VQYGINIQTCAILAILIHTPLSAFLVGFLGKIFLQRDHINTCGMPVETDAEKNHLEEGIPSSREDQDENIVKNLNENEIIGEE